MYDKEDYGIENLTVTCTDSFYTKDPNVTYHLTGGRAQIYVVPHKNGDPQRRVALCTVKEGQMIPPLCHADRMSHTDWFFGIAALDEKITMEVVPAAPTQVLCRAFLEKAGVDTYAMEGFEGSLIEVYLREVLKDRVYIERSEKGGKAAQEAQLHFIYDFFAGNDTQAGYDSSAFLRTAAYALKALRVKLPDPDRMPDKSRLTLDDLRDRADFNYRDVVLDPDWYTHDCGVVLGTSQGRPVACVPGIGGRYTAYFGDEKRKVRLTKKTAATIEPRAKVLERSLPDGKLTKKQLAMYVLKGLRRGDIACVVVLEVICTLIGILLPKLNQLIYDEYIPMGNSRVLIEMCAMIGAFMIGNVFFSLVKSLFTFVVQTRAGYDIQDASYRRIFRMSESFFRRFESADLAERLMSVGSTVNGLIAGVLTTGLASVVSFLYIFQMLKYAKSLTLISLLMVAAYTLLTMSFSLAAVKKTKVIAEKGAAASSRLYQYITGIDKIRMSGAEERMLSQYMAPFMEGQQEAIRKGRLDNLSTILMGAGSTVFSMVLYYLIVKRDLKLSMGSFIAFNTAFGTVSGALMNLIGLWLDYKKTKPSVERFAPIMEEENERTDGKDEIAELKGAIALDHVTFAYDTSAKPVLNDLSFSIKPGEYVGLVGPSGCGKSTILKLLLGFEKPQSGYVYYDGKDMNTVNLNSLRRRLGTVLQNGQLISGSIYENISISVNNATMGDVMKVVEMVGLKDDIAQMPMGIQTMVSEDGGTISGGQKQRILIARAIFNDPKVLLFDEATSALDNLTQAMVSESLDAMNITRIVIAHRLSTIRNCDRILVVNSGEIVEEGDYDSLMAKRGMFWQMAMRQLTEEDEAYEEND